MTDETESPFLAPETIKPPPPPTFEDHPLAKIWAKKAIEIVIWETLTTVLFLSIAFTTEDWAIRELLLLPLFAQWLVAVLWLGMGHTHFRVRISLVLLPVLAMAAVTSHPRDSAEVFGAAVPFVSLLALLGVVAKAFGFRVFMRLSDGREFYLAQGNLRQFSLANLFGLTTFVAVIAALFKWEVIEFPKGDLGSLLVSSASVTILAVVAAGAVLCEVRGAVVGALGAGLLVTGLVSALMGVPESWLLCLAAIMLQLSVMLVLLPFRIAGFRLRWTPSDIAPMDSKTATPTT